MRKAQATAAALGLTDNNRFRFLDSDIIVPSSSNGHFLSSCLALASIDPVSTSSSSSTVTTKKTATTPTVTLENKNSSSSSLVDTSVSSSSIVSPSSSPAPVPGPTSRSSVPVHTVAYTPTPIQTTFTAAPAPTPEQNKEKEKEADQSVGTSLIHEVDTSSSHFHVKVILKGQHRSILVNGMVDSGATSLFISPRFVAKHHIIPHSLPREIGLRNIDGSVNKSGTIKYSCRLTVTIGRYTAEHDFLVADLGPEDLILGLPWLREVNPQVDWKSGTMVLDESRTESGEILSDHPFQKINANRIQRRQWVRAGILTNATDEVWCAAGYTLSTKLAAEVNLAKETKTFEQMVPSHYHKYRKVFSEEESHRLPEHKPWDHAIDLKPDTPETLRSKVYPMPLNEQEELDRFLEENIKKGYIVPSKSPMASPVFFVKKKDGKLRLIQDYRKLNNISIKNQYPLPLAADIIN